MFGNYEPEIIKGKYNMEINYDTDFDICDTCPSLHDCDEHKVVQDRGEKWVMSMRFLIAIVIISK